MNITHKRFKNISLAIALLLSVISIIYFGFTSFQSKTKAIDVNKFNPGNIISDDVMANYTTMNVQQIQSFLESKNACNDTNIAKAKQYPHLNYNIKNGKFVCMAKDTFNGKSAAQIIYNASRQYKINPQVIIILLEKEQGLVTDTWPNHIQYRSATGYGCPDTAACDSESTVHRDCHH